MPERPFTIKQVELLSEICHNANRFHIGGLESIRDINKLRNWKRFDPEIIDKIEKKFTDIAMISEEISSLSCMLKNSRS